MEIKKKLKELLRYVPGYRSGVMWKEITAFILLCVLVDSPRIWSNCGRIDAPHACFILWTNGRIKSKGEQKSNPRCCSSLYYNVSGYCNFKQSDAGSMIDGEVSRFLARHIGYSHTKQLFRIKWAEEMDFDLRISLREIV